MPDHFAIFHQPRRPWLDDALLKDAFHQTAGQIHPDIAGGSAEKSAALNAAYAVLREPASRLKHLLELEQPGVPFPPSVIPAEFTARFAQIANLRQRSAALRKKEGNAATSSVSAALVSIEKSALRDDLETELAAVEALGRAANDELQRLDEAWENRPPGIIGRLAALQQQFAFLAKWQAQLREDLFHLGA
jgi:curved DNA-binding protein CbpA